MCEIGAVEVVPVRVEVRATHPGGWRAALAWPGDGLLVGDSACPRKLPALAELREARAAAAAAGRSFRVELPPAYERSFAVMEAAVLALAGESPGLEVVVNDWGMLASLRDAAAAGALRLSAGPLLCYSFAHCPWHEEIVAEERPAAAAGVQVLSLDSPHGIALLRRLGVTAVEADLLPELGPSWCRLAAAGLEVNGRAGAALAAAGRVCHTLRLAGQPAGDCHPLCQAPIRLETTHRWELLDNTQHRLEPAVRKALPQMELWGNTVYVPVRERPDARHLGALTRVVLDVRWAGPAEIEAWREAVAGGL